MRKICHSFNMVEIVLAIGVVAFGITGVMALLPPALNANRDVVNDSFVDEGISKMQALFNTEFLKNWDKYISDKQTKNYIKKYTSSSYSSTNASLKKDYTKANCSALFSGDMHDVFNIYNKDNVYYIESGFPGTSETKTAIHATIWRADLDDIFYNPTGGYLNASQTNDGGYGGYRIYIEFSWPVTAEYDIREKRIIVYDIFNNQK